MHIDDCFQLGYVIRKHGTKGEVQVFLDTDVPEEYNGMESVFIRKEGDQLIPFFIHKIEVRGQKAVIKFEDIETAVDAEALTGHQLYLPDDVLPELEAGQFYYHEVIGFQVIDTRLGALGRVVSFITLGPQHLMEMEYKNAQVLIPVTDEIVIGPNMKKEIMEVNLPDGLLDIYL